LYWLQSQTAPTSNSANLSFSSSFLVILWSQPGPYRRPAETSNAPDKYDENHKSLIVFYNLFRCSLYLGQNRRKCSIFSLSLPHSHIGDVMKPHRKQSSFNIVSPSSNRQYSTPVFLSAGSNTFVVTYGTSCLVCTAPSHLSQYLYQAFTASFFDN